MLSATRSFLHVGRQAHRVLPVYRKTCPEVSLFLMRTHGFADSVSLQQERIVSPVVDVNKRHEYKPIAQELLEKVRLELEAVDANKDGKIDSEEFKELLRTKNLFKDAEVLEISELFYAGNSGKPVPFDRLLASIEKTLTLPEEHASKSELGVGSCAAEYYYDLNHHHWEGNDLDIKVTHVEPQTTSDKIAYGAVKVVRVCFDGLTGWNGTITTKKVMRRVIFLETIAAVPGMVAAIIRHFKSLRSMERDGGLINMFLEEATNERMHLLSFVTMRNPSIAFRAAVIGSQFAFGSGFLLAYMISPQFCHRFVGYIEEEACSTYTKIIEAVEEAPEGSDLAMWREEKAPNIAISYWKLGENGTVLDMIYAVRADEAEHRDVNHGVCMLKAGEVNPRFDPAKRIDSALNKYVRDLMTR